MTASSPSEALPELRNAHETMELGPYLRGLWERRSYVLYVAISELRSRQVTNVLGNLWHLLNPALNIFVYFMIFGLLLKVDRGVDNFILFLSAGIFIFQMTQRATISGAGSIVGNKGLLRAVKFPRALLPITSTVTETLASMSAFVVLYGIAVLTGESVAFRWFLLPLVLAVQSVFNFGAAMVAARLAAHLRDVQQILPFIFRLLFYASGVIFNVTAYVEDNRAVELLFVLNPLYCFLSVGRWCMTGGDLDGWLIVSGLVWSVSVLLAGFLWFRAGEERYARD